MKSARILIYLVAFILLLPFQLSANDAVYTGSLAGVECAACKKTIAQALGKIDGVKTIRITKKSDGGHQLEVVTDGTRQITKADANKALEKADHYKILSWSKSTR